jgi:aarF domain-containing kinase
MRYADFLIDLAAVVKASRSVASRHLELRGRQLDQYGRTSSIVRSIRGRESQVPRRPGTPGSPAAPPPDATTAQPDAAGVSPPGFTASSPRPVHEPTLSERHDAYRDLTHGSSKQPIPEVPLTQSDQGRPGFHPADPDDVALHAGLNESVRNNGPPITPKPLDVGDLPPDVDVNVFHTNRGASMLEGHKDYLGKIRPATPPPKPSWFKDFGHSNKDETAVPSPPADIPAPSVEAQAVKDVPKPFEDAAEPVQVESEASALPDTPNGDVLRSISSTSESPVVDHVPETKVQGTEQEHTEMLKDVLAQAEATAPSETGEASTRSPTEAPAASSYVLRESKVPSTRLGRMWNYGSLAAGMLGGAISEGVSRGFGGGSSQGSMLLSAGNMERLVSKLSRMRGAALKLGQLISFQDSKMVPEPIQQVLQRVQDRADYMPAWQRDRVLIASLGAEWRDLFSDFEEKPIAAASIGQVHRATLKSGQKVAVKIQFPGVADSINSDLDNLSMLLLATKMLPRGLYLNKTIDNARTELGWECDYEREAQCGQRYRELLEGEQDVFVVPKMYPEACGKHVLTMEFMSGVGVTRVTSFTQEQRDWIGTQILRLCLREITEFKFMQTDPNWTNFLYNAETQKLELLDFGASREYPAEFVTLYVNLLAAAARSDRDTVKDLSEKLGYLTGHESKIMVDAHLASVLTLAEPFLQSAPDVYDFKDQTITERVKALIPVMIRERLAPPPEETYSLHRKLSGAFLLCARLGSRVRCKELFERALEKTDLEVQG